ncbi:ParB/RepB/Spo0J family partition protein [Ralstonia solanacearum]|uniref:ParB/RepB/Spo0J family partition protein n=1 Tax=Ralstonia solanacearum TaxID=305 RepID=UPI0005C49FC4|nr:ParB/RepB/Spo0J family partition protein [Ralstonia solanacearum]MDB0543942.1 ParB/RepB/Spo0J family partition protein [Ralstonia solanacearum]MDB0553794.1 ParB/RepB/Spo0J family partition protein [Ralstonia solanacearum]MDB0558880.1 ParB/RepB/Spo0J family partition protein [Ralstonia solanacearum]
MSKDTKENKGQTTQRGGQGSKLTIASGLMQGFKNEKDAIQSREKPQDEATSAPPPADVATEPDKPTEVTALVPPSGTGRIRIPIAECVSNPYNPRIFYPEAKIQELALTLQREGQIEAIKFTQLEQFPGKFVIIDGERRLRAKRFLGETLIDAEERQDFQPIDLYTTAYRANNDHERQSIFDDAIAWRQLMEQGVVPDQNTLAEKVTKDKTYVSKVLSLNALPRAILERMAESADRVGLQAAYCLKLIFDRAGEEVTDRHLTAFIEGKRTVRDLELAVRNIQAPDGAGKKGRTRYHQLYDFKTDGVQRGQLKTFPDGRISLELKDIPQEHQETLAERIKALVDQYTQDELPAASVV